MSDSHGNDSYEFYQVTVYDLVLLVCLHYDLPVNIGMKIYFQLFTKIITQKTANVKSRGIVFGEVVIYAGEKSYVIIPQ